MSRLWALALSTHPGPALAVTVILALLGIAGGLEPWRVVALGVTMALNQASVGLSNDWIDADRDRVAGRADKPVARGDISPSMARNAAFVTAAAAIAVSILVGWAAAAIHLVFLASAWAYNLGLKRTIFSAAPYVVSFGLLPSIATLAAPAASFATVGATIAGALLGIAAHVANVLPDRDDDERTGVRGLAHRMGHRTAHVVMWTALLGASVAVASELGFDTPVAIVGLVVALVIAALGIALGLRGVSTRVLFRLVILAAVLDVALLVIAQATTAAA